ncbi:MAG: methylmalonyl-CoA mutase family protein [Nocardioides sp.]
MRGTVQADILKEDQGQNTCLFSTEFSLRMMADIQEWFIQHGVRNFYSVSISRLSHRRGRGEPDQPARVHAGQRVHLRRGLSRTRDEDRRLRAQPVVSSSPTAWTRNTRVLGRVARRIWAVAMQEKYGAGERVAEAEVPRPDRAAVHCTRRRWTSTTSARRCRR